MTSSKLLAGGVVYIKFLSLCESWHLLYADPGRIHDQSRARVTRAFLTSR